MLNGIGASITTCRYCMNKTDSNRQKICRSIDCQRQARLEQERKWRSKKPKVGFNCIDCGKMFYRSSGVRRCIDCR